MGHAAYLLQGPQHGLLFVDAAHAHVHVQDLRAALLLLLRELHHLIEIPLPQLGLQQLFPGGIDALPHDQEAALQTEGHRTALRSQETRPCLPPGHFLHRPLSKGGVNAPDEFRRGPATPAQNGSARLHQKPHLLREFLRPHVIAGLPPLVQEGKPRIGLRDDRKPFRAGRHIRHHLPHLGRPGGAVDAHGIGPQAFQHDGGGPGIRPVQRPAARLESHRHHHGQVTDLLCRDQGRPGLPQAHHGLHYQQIHARLAQGGYLLLVYINQLFQLHLPHRGQLLPRHGEISRQVHRPVRPGRSLPGDGRQSPDHLPQLPFQPIIRQFDPIGRKSRHIQDIRPGRHIFPLQLQHHMGMLQYPLLRTYAGGHAGPHQIRARSPVQIYVRFRNTRKFFLCHILLASAVGPCPAHRTAPVPGESLASSRVKFALSIIPHT